MPGKITEEEYKNFLSSKFKDKIELVGRYLGAMVKTKHRCIDHNIEFYTSQNNLKTQAEKGKGSLCPTCIEVRRPRGHKGFSPSLTKEEVAKRFARKFGIRAPKILEYKSLTKKAKFKCVLCSEEFKTTPGRVLSRVHPCDNCRLSRFPFWSMTDQERDVISYLYSDLHFSVKQIADLTLLQPGTVARVLMQSGVMGKLNSTNGLRRSLDNDSISLVGYSNYLGKVRELSGRAYRAYADLIDPKGVRSPEFHLDHKLSVHDAYSKFSEPLPLNIVAHPVNLKVITASENCKKNHKSTLSLRKLKTRIKKFDKAKGEFVLPENYQLKFKSGADVLTNGIKVIGFDPGTKNFGAFVGTLFGIKSLRKIRIHRSFMVTDTLKSFSTLSTDAEAFKKVIEQLLVDNQPNVIVIERFQARGLKGATVELISAMVGMLLSIVQEHQERTNSHIVIHYITAATWKNHLNRVSNLEYIYGLVKGKEKHRLDACLMSLKIFPEDNPYRFLTKKRIQLLVNYIQQKSG